MGCREFTGRGWVFSRDERPCERVTGHGNRENDRDGGAAEYKDGLCKKGENQECLWRVEKIKREERGQMLRGLPWTLLSLKQEDRITQWVKMYISLFLSLYLSSSGLSCGTRDLFFFFFFGCSMWDLVPSPWITPGPPALGVWSLSHRTTRKVYISLWRLGKLSKHGFMWLQSQPHRWDQTPP